MLDPVPAVLSLTDLQREAARVMPVAARGDAADAGRAVEPPEESETRMTSDRAQVADLEVGEEPEQVAGLQTLRRITSREVLEPVLRREFGDAAIDDLPEVAWYFVDPTGTLLPNAADTDILDWEAKFKSDMAEIGVGPEVAEGLAIVLSISPAGTALDVAEGSQQALDAFLKGENMDGFLELGGIALDTVKAEKVKAAARAMAPGAVDALSDMVRKSAPLRAAKAFHDMGLPTDALKSAVGRFAKNGFDFKEAAVYGGLHSVLKGSMDRALKAAGHTGKNVSLDTIAGLADDRLRHEIQEALQSEIAAASGTFIKEFGEETVKRASRAVMEEIFGSDDVVSPED
jgi:hypothetical protein